MKRNIFFTSVLIIFTAGCQKISYDSGRSPENAKKAAIHATVAGYSCETKTSLGSGDLVLWSEKDSIGIFEKTGLDQLKKFILSEGAGTTTGKFDGPELSGDTLIAIYPYSAIDSSVLTTPSDTSYSIGVKIPSTIHYTENTFPEESNLAVGVGDTSSVIFRNVMGVLELKLYATSTRSVKRIQLAASEPLAGSAILSFNKEGGYPKLEFLADSSKVITIEFDTAIKVSTDEANPTSIYLNVPAGALRRGITVSMMNANADPLYFYTRTTKNNTVTRSVIHSMPAVKVAPQITRSELANCIIVNPTCTTSFYCLRPDGELPGHAYSQKIIMVSSAVSGSSAQGSAAFLVNGALRYIAANEGNAVIALSDGFKTVWSWNMWTTDTPADLTLSDGSVIMDRNLGATATSASDITSKIDETHGRQYQWGRKDWAYNVSTTKVESTAETGTARYVTENPTVFIATSAGCTNTGDWNFKGDDGLWGETKTAYDPCPAGYKVPNGTGSTAMWTACNFAANKGTYDSTNKGYNFSVLQDGGTAWFPYAAYYNESGTKYSGGYYWNYNSVNMTGGVKYSRLFKVLDTAVTNSSNAKRGYACTIRCIKITE